MFRYHYPGMLKMTVGHTCTICTALIPVAASGNERLRMHLLYVLYVPDGVCGVCGALGEECRASPACKAPGQTDPLQHELVE